MTSAAGPRPGWKPARAALAVAGALLLVYLLMRIGVRAVLSELARLGPWFLVPVALGLGWLFVQALAWRLVQAARFRPVPLSLLYRAKIVGDSLNALIPSASVGGEAARAFMLRGHVPLTEGVPGVMVDKTIEFTAGVLFLAAGFLASLFFVDLPGWMDAAAGACLGASALGIAALVLAQKKGVLWTLERLARALPRLGPFVAGREAKLREVDRNLRLAYGRPDARTAAAGGLHFLARLLGAVEVYAIMSALGEPVTFVQAVFVSAGVSIVNTVLFLVPGHIGVMEGAHVLVLQSLGFPAGLGLAVGVIRRVRKLATVAVGLAIFGLGKSRTGTEPTGRATGRPGP